MCNACGNFIVVTKQKILVISLTDFYNAVSRRHNGVILLPAIRRVSGNDFFPAGQCTSTLCHARAVQELNCCIKKCQTFLRPTYGLQTAQITNLWIMRSRLLCSIVSTTDKFIVWMNWNGGSKALWCLVWSWTVDFWRDYWPVARKTSSVCLC